MAQGSNDTTAPRPPADAPARGPQHATLDGLFRRSVVRHAGATALIDPPDRERFTDGAARQLTYAEADAAASALAERLMALGLGPRSVVAFQIPNIAELAVTLLAIMRAGMVAVPLPLLWREQETIATLTRVGAQALITCTRIGPVDHGALAMRVAAATYSIRFVCAFGREPPDGVTGLDDVFAGHGDAASAADQPAAPGEVALMTFEPGARGLLPVARHHGHLIAGGIAIALAARLGAGATILAALTLPSFAGLATTVLPWLITGGTLELHQPFDPALFARQSERARLAVLPGALVAPLAEAGFLRSGSVAALWRAPDTPDGSRWRAAADLIDVRAFGEVGLVPARRGSDGRPVPLTAGRIQIPRADPTAPVLVEVARTPKGTLALGGAMVPRDPYRATADNGTDAAGLVDTLCPCAIEADGEIKLTPRAGRASAA